MDESFVKDALQAFAFTVWLTPRERRWGVLDSNQQFTCTSVSRRSRSMEAISVRSIALCKSDALPLS